MVHWNDLRIAHERHAAWLRVAEQRTQVRLALAARAPRPTWRRTLRIVIGRRLIAWGEALQACSNQPPPSTQQR